MQNTQTETYTHPLTDELNAQHTIQSEDLLAICAIANRETNINNVFDQIETWRFEQFFGLACHLFITTKSQQSRVQLAKLLPKFGSMAVVSLTKIAHHFGASGPAQDEVKQLAIQSLKEMPLPSLVIGLSQVITDKDDSKELMPTIVPTLIALAAHHQEPLFAALAQRLPISVWNRLQTILLRALADLRHEERFSQRQFTNTEHRIEVHVKKEIPQLVEVA